MTTWEDAVCEARAAEARIRRVVATAGVALPYLATGRSIAYASPTPRIELGSATVADTRRLADLIAKGLESEGQRLRPVPAPGVLVTDTRTMDVGKVVGWDSERGALTLAPADGGELWDTTVYRESTERERLEFRIAVNRHQVQLVTRRQ
ncbi:hypothetical protein IHE55_09205 [Streptomyces pactum]|uniref:Uncharacterized protein n=1 Tax=Streptomyces pactum TaxID=68249 RepID=A0ABS0NID6_9ACTN|nr:hypothetical protein [Streptomyces pactum]MBH5334961.1 hypothetical protein [Streptomyces pactum]